jgi:hypothetical protein
MRIFQVLPPSQKPSMVMLSDPGPAKVPTTKPGVALSPGMRRYGFE